MSRGGRIIVNSVAAVFILAFIFIFTALFVSGGQMMLDQNITQDIKDAFHSALQPFAEPCSNADNDTSTSTQNHSALTIQTRGESWGVYMCPHKGFLDNNTRSCERRDLQHDFGICLPFAPADWQSSDKSPAGVNYWQSFRLDKNVSCLLVSPPYTVDCTADPYAVPFRQLSLRQANLLSGRVWWSS